MGTTIPEMEWWKMYANTVFPIWQVRQLVLEVEYWTRIHSMLAHVDYRANHHDDGHAKSHVHTNVLKHFGVLDVSEREHDRKGSESDEA